MRQQEKRIIADWQAEKTPLDPDAVATDPAKKRVGHSSRHLRCEDFDLLKTLGTGRTLFDLSAVVASKVRRLLEGLQAKHRAFHRNFCTSVAGAPSKSSPGRRGQSLCPQDSAKSGR